MQSLYPDSRGYSPDPRKIYVVYAHLGSNNLYEVEIKKLPECDILINNIIEIEELPVDNFGIDNKGCIGCA